MPHAEQPNDTSKVNGTTSTQSDPGSPSYKSLSHLKSYPIVSDSIRVFESHPLGQRSISLSQSCYSTFLAPITPYLSRAAPYVSRADEFADSNLGKIDNYFPILKEPTDEIKNVVVEAVGYPKKLVGEVYLRGADYAKEGKEYVFKVYEDECSKSGGTDGVIPKAKATVTTGLVVSSEIMGSLAAYLGNKREEAKAAAQEKTEPQTESQK